MEDSISAQDVRKLSGDFLENYDLKADVIFLIDVIDAKTYFIDCGRWDDLKYQSAEEIVKQYRFENIA